MQKKWGYCHPWWLDDVLKWRVGEFGGTIDAVYKELVAIITSGQDSKIIATGIVQSHSCAEDKEIPLYDWRVNPPTLHKHTTSGLLPIASSEWLAALPAIDDRGQPTRDLKCAVCRRLAWRGVVFADEDALIKAWLPIIGQGKSDYSRLPPDVASRETGGEQLKKRNGKPGRKLGSGSFKDDAALYEMLRRLADGSAPSIWAAAEQLKGEVPGQSPDASRARLSAKFRKKFGSEPPSGETWADIAAAKLKSN